MNRDSLKLAAVLGLILMVAAALSGCGESRSRFAGSYRSLNPAGQKNCIDLVLDADGKGIWTVKDVPQLTTEFTWVVNDGKIWIYLKTGAIIIITSSAGGEELSADMSGGWHPGCPPNSCVTFKRVVKGE